MKVMLNDRQVERVKAMYDAVMLLAAVIMLLFAVFLLVLYVPARASASESESDERIESSAKKSYVFQTYLKDDAIQIESRNGVVTLTGTVAEEPRKSLAQETAACLPGVKSVDNRLVVKGESATGNSDALLGMKIKTALLLHRSVSAMTEVSAEDGIVTLRGDATSQAQKDLTTELVKDIEGVKGVQNEMIVSDASMTDEKTMGQMVRDVSESIDDASITALVKLTLLYHRSTSALNTTVKTNGGVVTVAGMAKNAAEKDLVTKFVRDVHGVKEVVNNMTIEATPSKTN
jgi:hyperosmotically inducible periplasmic protein